MKLLADLGERATTDNGRVSWPMIDLPQYQTAVHSAVIILDPTGDEVNAADSYSIVRKAITDEIVRLGGGNPIGPESFLDRVNRNASAFFRRHPQDYVLLSSLSIEKLPESRIISSGCVVSPLRKRDRSFYRMPDAFSRVANESLRSHAASSSYLPIKVKTSGRSVHEAASRGLSAINLLRGLWTLPATFGHWVMRFGGTARVPLGVVHAGPVHTLHKLDGSPASDIFWYELDYAGEQQLFRPAKGWPDLEKKRKWIFRRIRRLPHRKDVERLIVRFALALDQLNLDLAFLQIWSILEVMTDTVGSRYDETITRAAALWADPEDRRIVKETLECLRRQRNRLVHAALSDDNRERIAYMIKLLVEPHIEQLIRNDFKVDSIKEYGEFLALPTDLTTLKERRLALGRSIRLREK